MATKNIFLNHKKLGLYIGLAAVALSILPMLVIYLITSQKASTELLNTVSKDIKSRAIFISHGISAIYNQHEIAIKNLSQSDVFETLNINAITQYLNEVITDNPNFISIEIADSSGNILIDTSNNNSVGKNFKDINSTLSNEFHRAANGKQGDIFSSDLLTIGPSNTSGRIYITPITDNTNLNVINILIIKTNLYSINNMIFDFNFDEDKSIPHHIYIINKSGKVITSTDSDFPTLSTFLLANKNRQLLSEITKRNSSGSVIYETLGGDKFLTSYADINIYSSNQTIEWTVLNAWSLSQLSQPASEVKKQIAITSIIMAISVFLLMTLMGRRIIKLVWSQSNFDALTQLPNRQLLSDRLLQSINTAKRSKKQSALLFLDLDQFKGINDTLGHNIGDELLLIIADRISHCIRDMDTIARIGGDEFAVIINDFTSVPRLESISQQILKIVSSPIKIGHDVIYTSASIGITIYPKDGDTIDQLLKNADQAMYLSKNEGRNQFRFFTKEMQVNAEQRLKISNRLHDALKNSQFELYYQPIISLEDGIIRKAEALIRWNDPVHGTISPLEFIQIAEETNQIMEIGDWVFKEAVRQVQEWQETSKIDLQISINASPIQFKSEHLSQKWAEYLDIKKIPQESIIVEITEGILMVNDQMTSDHLLNFRDAGIPVAIDDFGTGYSALSYLNKLDIDYLKIDKSFIDGIAESDGDFHLTEAIIAVAHKLGLEVIAEGVETEKQHQILQHIGCDYCQGYLFSKPLNAFEFEKFLKLNNATHTTKRLLSPNI